MTVFRGGPAVVAAVLDFLESGNGGANQTLNDVLTDVRTAHSIVDGDGTDGTPVTLPDIKAFFPWVSPGPFGSKFPHIGIEWAGHAGENDPHSGRGFSHRIRLVLYLPVAVVAPFITTAPPVPSSDRDEYQAAAYAAAMYDLALCTLFLRDASTGTAQGKSLANGGPGFAAGHVRRAIVTGSEVAAAGDPGAPALALITDLTVTISEPYRA